MALTTSQGGATQTATQSPQNSVQANGLSGGQPSGSVQPGTATSLLNGGSGIALHGSSLSVVNIKTAASQTQSVQPDTQPRHTNPALFGFSALLLVVAVALFLAASRSDKNTTN